jgi:hypothetical protein
MTLVPPPGAEKISDKALAERKAAKPTRSIAPQKGTEGPSTDPPTDRAMC